ncbi:hypothetical protein BTN50_1005 [Candidatus Enterovibrio altilux]|uniref:Mobile element protein n=1 Tax=Candidatus Enterovibrio altilux TaxID=1927128 RepID=A0A291B926_9GAMM|nr:hypothetical protein BTN50_1005 [Candidatus Enterovibrio luxaltus]
MASKKVWHLWEAGSMDKLHLAIDINMHAIIAAGLGLSNVIDGAVLPNLLKQTNQKSNEI